MSINKILPNELKILSSTISSFYTVNKTIENTVRNISLQTSSSNKFAEKIETWAYIILVIIPSLFTILFITLIFKVYQSRRRVTPSHKKIAFQIQSNKNSVTDASLPNV